MANPRKPEQLKVVAGTDRADRVPAGGVDHKAIDDLPAPPDWLPNAHAIKEWNRLGPLLVRVNLLTDAGLSAFGQLCALHGKIVQLWAAGEAPTGHMMSQYRALINDFGLTPVSQGKVNPTGEKPKGNAFANTGKRRGA